MPSHHPQGLALVTQVPDAFAALAQRATLEHARDAALDMLGDLPQNPTTTEARKFLDAQATQASIDIETLNRVSGLVRSSSRSPLS